MSDESTLRPAMSRERYYALKQILQDRRNEILLDIDAALERAVAKIDKKVERLKKDKISRTG